MTGYMNVKTVQKIKNNSVLNKNVIINNQKFQSVDSLKAVLLNAFISNDRAWCSMFFTASSFSRASSQITTSLILFLFLVFILFF